MTQGQAYPLLFHRCESVSRACCVTETEREKSGGNERERKKDLCCGLTCFMDPNIITLLTVMINCMWATRCRVVLINVLKQPIESKRQSAHHSRKLLVYAKEKKVLNKGCLHMESTVVIVKTKGLKKQHMPLAGVRPGQTFHQNLGAFVCMRVS